VSTAPLHRPLLQPGQLVRRQRDPESLVGIVVGILMMPVELALVRWNLMDTTTEPMETLIEVLNLSMFAPSDFPAGSVLPRE
jgi:hypothetical protein